ncbi:aldo/keto reductase [Myxococcota bacterium]|nr:aldo/keto reductase [Myxococcota bacterium]
MRDVLITSLDRSVSCLGFGCSSIMGRVGRQASLDALAAAFDAGVNYFDVARSYGYGRAEQVVGEFLQGRRDRCVVATKVGIAPSLPGFATRWLLPTARALMGRLPALPRLLMRRRQQLSGVSKGHFDPQQVITSLDTSLRELGTDYVDILLLHEVSRSDLADDALIRCLEDIVGSGKARSLGIATGVSESLEILEGEFGFQVVQVPSHIDEPHPRDLGGDGLPLLVTHSALRLEDAVRARLIEWLESRPEELRALRDSGLAEAPLVETLPEILLAWTLAANPRGVTLCGMLQGRHVQGNLATADRVDACAEVLRTLGASWQAAASRLA